MQRFVCAHMPQAVVCEACGAPCLWVRFSTGERTRWHLESHVPLPGGEMKVLFRLHSRSACRGKAFAQLLRARPVGLTFPEI
jgi:hypothetical protein